MPRVFSGLRVVMVGLWARSNPLAVSSPFDIIPSHMMIFRAATRTMTTNNTKIKIRRPLLFLGFPEVPVWLIGGMGDIGRDGG